MTCLKVARGERRYCDHPDGYHHHGPCINLKDWTLPIINVPLRNQGKAGKVIWAELRGGKYSSGYGDEVFIYIGGETTSPAKSIFTGRLDHAKFFFANNRRQVFEFILSRIELWPDIDHIHTSSGRKALRREARGLMHISRNYRPIQYINPDSTESFEELIKECFMPRLSATSNPEFLRGEAERLLLRAAALEARPNEPIPEDPSDTAVVVWTMEFHEGSRSYAYAAIRTEQGTWYTTGPRAPKDYAWEELIDWIYRTSADGEDTEIWLATEFGLLG